MADYRGGSGYRCRRCSKLFGSKNSKWANKHITECSKKFNLEDNGQTYVVCAICGYHGKSLGKHVSDVHEIAPGEYEKKYGVIISCSAARKRYSEQNKCNCDWIKRAKENGDNLLEYRQKMGAAVSKAILASPSALKTRSVTMSRLNKTDEFRKRASETAKITSARPEIIEQRTKQLSKWREENFEEFYKKCTLKMLKRHSSKPEKFLYQYLIEAQNSLDLNYNFKRQQIVKSRVHFVMNKSQRKTIDIADLKKRTLIEFDESCHFVNHHGQNVLNEIQQKDKALDQFAIEHGYTLYRLCQKTCSYKSKNVDKVKVYYVEFNPDALKKLFELLSNPQPGVYCIGESYGEKNLLK